MALINYLLQQHKDVAKQYGLTKIGLSFDRTQNIKRFKLAIGHLFKEILHRLRHGESRMKTIKEHIETMKNIVDNTLVLNDDDIRIIKSAKTLQELKTQLEEYKKELKIKLPESGPPTSGF
jgi:hypothetical protein